MKTFRTCGLIESRSTEKFINNIVNFSARTNVNYTQDVIMSKLDRRRKGVYGPAIAKVVAVPDCDWMGMWFRNRGADN